jgi:hypothetical protein
VRYIADGIVEKQGGHEGKDSRMSIVFCKYYDRSVKRPSRQTSHIDTIFEGSGPRRM